MANGFLADFKANLQGNFSRAYLFYVKFDSVPTSVTLPENQKYLVRSTSLPESTIEAITVPYQGMEYKIGSTSTYSEGECTFNADKEMELRDSFVKGKNIVHSPVTNRHGNPDDYFGTVVLEMLDPFQDFGSGEASPNYTTTIYHAWPSSVGTIELSYDNKDVAQFSVTFTYNGHIEEKQ